MKFSDLVFKDRKNNPMFGIQATGQFKNGYGYSVVRGPYTYGGREGLYEIAVLKGGGLCYDTHITDNVLGHQTENDIELVLAQIEALPSCMS